MESKVIGTGSYVPDNVIDNNYLSNIVDTSDEWIYERTGIKRRRTVTCEGTSDMAAKAAMRAIEDAGINPLEIDMIITATASPDYAFPNTSCIVQKKCGASNAVCFDISAACTGFVYAFSTAVAYIKSGMYKTILIIGAETMSKLLDWSDRGTCVLFGDGAGAAVITADDNGFAACRLESDGEKGQVLECAERVYDTPFKKAESDRNMFISMDGREVFKFAVTKVPKIIDELLIENNLKKEDIAYFVLHQANERIISSVAKRLKVDEDKFPVNLKEYGNTSAASVPILLDEMNKKNMIKKGDKIVLSGFGGGLTLGAIVLEWQK